MKRAVGALMATLALTAPACSFSGVRGPPRGPLRGELWCSSYAVPTIDLILTAVLVDVARRINPSEDGPNVTPIVVGLVASPFISLSSSIHGYRAVASCRHKRDTFRAPATASRSTRPARAP